jgi:hypothetical protein
MQFGFKAGTGTTEAIFVLRSFMFYVTRVLKVPAFAVFIDLRKAFPSLSRVKTVETLRRKGVPEKITRAVASLMSGSVQRLRVNGKLTTAFPVTSGTPEGSINSPEVFAIVYKAMLEELDIHEVPEDLSLIERGKIYYIIFADDLSFFSLDVEPLGERTNEFKESGAAYDMAMNAGKSKWMAFLPNEAPNEIPESTKWEIVVGGDRIENVDEFVYLGYKLDCRLDDSAHVKMINERYLRAAQVTGRLMNELRCVNLTSLRRFFVSLVFSQLYGLIFVDEALVEFERGVGIFLKMSMGLPLSFPHVVACAMLGIKHVKIFQMEQRIKFLSRWEAGATFPVFNMLVCDRAVLFPRSVGLNARLGQVLVSIGVSRTIDYREHYQSIKAGLLANVETEHRTRLLATEGRAVWTELSQDGLLGNDLKISLSKLTYETVRIVVLLFADVLCWSALRIPTRTCPTCKSKFTTSHFFSCPRFFRSEQGWRIFVSLCRAGSWDDVMDFIFDVMVKWVTETHYFRPSFRLNVLEYESLCRDPYRASFRWHL